MKQDIVIDFLNELWEIIIFNLDKTLSLRKEITYKNDGSPVTSADLWHEEIISKFLLEKFTNIMIISEESYQGEKIPENGWIAILDPIDGTENFASGLKEWGVALSIWKDQKHICSSLYLPELNDYLITGQKVEKFKSRIIGCSSSFNEEIGEIIKNNMESRIIGCCAYNSFNVIKGSYKQFINPKGAYCWDLQASLMLAQEHSCKIDLNGKKYYGELLAPNKRHCVFISN